MGDAADDMYDRAEREEQEIALHSVGRCDPWYCPICINNELEEG